MKTAVIDVGGGLRGIYAAGVFDTCLDDQIHFDLAIGVSAGSGNILSYIAGQRGRNYKYYIEYSRRPEYMGLDQLVKEGSLINLDYIYGELSREDGENPLDYEKVLSSPIEWYVVATEADTGEVRFFDRKDLKKDDYSILAASSAVPLACNPYPVGDEYFVDGGVANPVPIEDAFRFGADRAVLILTKPEDLVRQSLGDINIAAMLSLRYPKIAELMVTRAERYNQAVAYAQKLSQEGKVLIISPDDTEGVRMITRNSESLQRLYERGLRDGKEIRSFMQNALSCG